MELLLTRFSLFDVPIPKWFSMLWESFILSSRWLKTKNLLTLTLIRQFHASIAIKADVKRIFPSIYLINAEHVNCFFRKRNLDHLFPIIYLDVDECRAQNGGCSHICVNKFGSHECRCRAGYKIHSNNKSCTGKRTANDKV